ncbi:hypothetical protein C2E23DRAFT_821887, partial [Lenzites betulinus]
MFHLSVGSAFLTLFFGCVHLEFHRLCAHLLCSPVSRLLAWSVFSLCCAHSLVLLYVFVRLWHLRCPHGELAQARTVGKCDQVVVRGRGA